MSKWKCDICGKEFENFHAQGFNHKIYCPLCFFKEENRRLKIEKQQLEIQVDRVHSVLSMVREKRDLYKEVIEEVRECVEREGLYYLDLTNQKIWGERLLKILDKAKEVG